MQTKSFTNPELVYETTSGNCTCPDYIYRRQATGDKCKHMKALLEVSV